MSALLRMLNSSSQVKTGGVQEDVLLAISTLVEGILIDMVKFHCHLVDGCFIDNHFTSIFICSGDT